MFASAWLKDMGDAGGLFIAAITLALILMTQGPLLFETITQSFVPNSSSGLKLLKVHTEAEKKVIEDDLPGAIAEYESIVAKDPEDLDALYRLAEICCQNHDYAKAAKAYHAIVARGRDLGIGQHCSALTRLSEIYANNLGDIEKARKCIRTIITEYPETKYAGVVLADGQLCRGRIAGLDDLHQTARVVLADATIRPGVLDDTGQYRRRGVTGNRGIDQPTQRRNCQ